MTEYRYRELTDAELRELEPGAEIYVRDSALDTWRGPLMFNKFCPGSSFPIHTVSNMWVYAAIREPVEQRITMDREYVMRCGFPVRLYATDGARNYPVHGAYHDGAAWRPIEWTETGRHNLGADSHYDLIPAPDWREQIPWDALADWVQWVARDSEGEWWAYQGKPQPLTAIWQWRAEKTRLGKAIRMPEGPTDWREAIAQRPEAK